MALIGESPWNLNYSKLKQGDVYTLSGFTKYQRKNAISLVEPTGNWAFPTTCFVVEEVYLARVKKAMKKSVF